MEVVITYIKATGSITRMVSNPYFLNDEVQHVESLIPPQEVFLVEVPDASSFDCSEWFVENKQIIEKTPYPETVISNGLVTGLPKNTNVLWPDGVETIENDGSIEFESNVSGDFDFVLSHVRYITKELVVHYNV